MKMKVDVKLTNGKEDSCVVTDEDAMTIAECFIDKGVLMIGKVGDYASLYPAHAVASVDIYSWED
jgi:hypothetical protein